MANGKKPATYEDIEALPVGWVGEILEDELVATRPPLGVAHATLMLLAVLLEPFGLGRGGAGQWRILPRTEVHLGQDILVPDVVGWHWQRMPNLPAEAHFVTVAPDWVCEVLSPSTVTVDRERKLPIYHREGVAHVWLIDPFAHTLEVYRREPSGWVLTATHEGDELVRAEPFDTVPLELGLLWWERPGVAPAG